MLSVIHIVARAGIIPGPGTYGASAASRESCKNPFPMPRFCFSFAVFLMFGIAEVSVLAQFPGTGYPGSGYPGQGPSIPGIGFPRRGGKKKPAEKKEDTNAPHLEKLSGLLRKIDESSITLTAPDTRTITARRSEKTKFFRKDEPAGADVFKPGDHIRVEATRDDEGFFYAVSVYLDSEGTAEERVSASEPAAISTQASENQDEARPVLRRGKPTPRTSADGKEPEKEAPAKPGDWHPAPTLATAQAPEDPKIGKIREAVSTYTQSLPNYYCQQQMARFQSSSTPANWRAIDVVSASVVFEDGKEQYHDLTINGKPVKKGIEELSGSWSTGEFGTVIADLFSPSTAADFRLIRHGTIAGRDADVYDFEVEQEHSHWSIQVASQTLQPGYKGSVWVDAATARVLRVEMQARKMPKEFPLDTVESAVDYQFVRMGSQEFLLPVHAETLTCIRGTSGCNRNVIDFRNYHHYTGQSKITL
jgi:hypothetical protein